MKNKEFYKLLKKNKSNSGFTLTELLVGMVMGTIVIGGLGFGLVHLLRTTQADTAKTAARNESSRALDFIADEVKRAVTIENASTNANGFDSTDRTVVLALDIPEINGNSDQNGDGNLLGVDNDLTTSERIVYFLQDIDDMPADTPWQGPLVLHRWGPALDANGNYTDNGGNPNPWQAEALIDGIDDTALAANAISCVAGQATTPAAPSGFYACIQDDNGDGIVEDGSADINGDGVINDEDDNDVDGIGISAQLFLTSGIDTGATGTVGETYTANTQVVARARVAPGNNSDDFNPYIMNYRTLNPRFACNPDTDWSMRTDFGDAFATPSNLSQWNHDQNEQRQAQPIRITGNTLVISSIPRRDSPAVNCLNSRVNNGRESPDPAAPRNFSGNQGLGENDDWITDDDVVAISHVINLKDPRTFNGDPDTCTSYPCTSSQYGKVYSQQDGAAATDNPHVKMLKHGSLVPDYGGYDANKNGVLESGDQKSLGEFLASQSPALAVADGTWPSGNTRYRITSDLKPNERIIAFEIGHEAISNTNAGVDFQDNIFVVSSEAFSQKFNTYEDNGSSGSYTPVN